MQQALTCKYCKRGLPDGIHGNSRYHKECAYKAKKDRTKLQYRKLKEREEEIKSNETILRKFYILSEFGHLIPLEKMDKAGFNWGIASGEAVGPNKEPLIVIGEYAYYLYKQSQTVTIWKLKSKK